jgi:hypothetical protein
MGSKSSVNKGEISINKDDITIYGNIQYTTSINQLIHFFNKDDDEKYKYIEQESNIEQVKKVVKFMKDKYHNSMDDIIDEIFIFKGNTDFSYKTEYINYACGYIAIHSERLDSLHFAIFDLLNAEYELTKKFGKQWNDLNKYPYIADKYNECELKEGYLTQKSMESIFCDMQEIFFEIMTLNKKNSAILYDQIINNKISYLIKILIHVNKKLKNILLKK